MFRQVSTGVAIEQKSRLSRVSAEAECVTASFGVPGYIGARIAMERKSR